MKIKTKKRLLLADNDLDYCRSLAGLLELENYLVDIASTMDEAISKLDSVAIDLVLVDLRLNDDKDSFDISGFEVAKKATSLSIPCVIISAFPTIDATRLALRSRGAKPLALDFIQKGNGPQAVLDTISVVFSRLKEPVVKNTGLRIDVAQGLVWVDGDLVDLSRYQYFLLSHLYQKQGAVSSASELIKVIYGEDVPASEAITDRRLEGLVERVREKIKDDKSNPSLLIKVYGRGYRLAVYS